MKPEKFQELLDEIEEFIGAHNLSNPHYLFDEEIVKAFSHSKKKHVKRALEEIR
jgi:hemerythrin superfamily protein